MNRDTNMNMNNQRSLNNIPDHGANPNYQMNSQMNTNNLNMESPMANLTQISRFQSNSHQLSLSVLPSDISHLDGLSPPSSPGSRQIWVSASASSCLHSATSPPASPSVHLHSTGLDFVSVSPSSPFNPSSAPSLPPSTMNSHFAVPNQYQDQGQSWDGHGGQIGQFSGHNDHMMNMNSANPNPPSSQSGHMSAPTHEQGTGAGHGQGPASDEGQGQGGGHDYLA